MLARKISIFKLHQTSLKAFLEHVLRPVVRAEVLAVPRRNALERLGLPAAGQRGPREWLPAARGVQDRRAALTRTTATRCGLDVPPVFEL